MGLGEFGLNNLGFSLIGLREVWGVWLIHAIWVLGFRFGPKSVRFWIFRIWGRLGYLGRGLLGSGVQVHLRFSGIGFKSRVSIWAI